MRKRTFLTTILLWHGSLACAMQMSLPNDEMAAAAVRDESETYPIAFDAFPIGRQAPFSIPGTVDQVGVTVFSTNPASRIILSSEGVKTFWIGQGSITNKFDRSINALSFDLECPLAPMDFIVTLLDEQGGAIYTHSYMADVPSKTYMSQTDVCHIDVFPDQPFQTALITTSGDWGLVDLLAVSEK